MTMKSFKCRISQYCRKYKSIYANSDLSIPQTKAVKSKILDTAFSSFDSFNNNKMRSNLSKEEVKALHNLLKQKHLVIQ